MERPELDIVELDLQAWRDAALMFGEHLSPVGPHGYYAFTPQQWIAWAKEALADINERLTDTQERLTDTQHRNGANIARLERAEACAIAADRGDPMENWLMKPALEWLEQAEHLHDNERCKMIASLLRDLWRNKSASNPVCESSNVANNRIPTAPPA